MSSLIFNISTNTTTCAILRRLTPPRARHHRRPPLPAAQIVPSLSFSNPFQQYAGGVIPGWEYGGEATLASDYITLTPATPNKVGWVWAAEPAALGSWEVQLEMHIGGAAQRVIIGAESVASRGVDSVDACRQVFPLQ